MNIQTTTPEPFQGVINSDHVIALLGIAARQQKSTVGSCPSVEQLAAFSAGKLKGKSRQTMLAHFNGCPTCYHNWLEIPVVAPEPIVRKILAFFSNWQIFVPVAVTATLMITVLTWLSQTPINPIDASYFTVLEHNPAGFSKIPLETTVLGFNDTESAPAVQAFSAGIERGRAELSHSSTPTIVIAKQWADEYALGRWLILLKTVSRKPNTAPPDFWTQQLVIAETFQARFQKRSGDEVTILDALIRIQPLLAKLQKQPDDRRAAYDLSDGLDIAISEVAEL